MKRGKVLMTVLVVLAVLFASCSNGMSKDDADGAAYGEKVMVSLGVDVEGAVSQKTISTDTNLDGLTYWYKANHNWVQDRPVHGDTGANYILIPKYSVGAAPKNIGYFTAGEWLFSVQVKKGNDIIYSAEDFPYTIYTGHASPEITVTPDGTGTGTIDITVKVPSTSGYVDPPENAKEKLTVICSAGAVEMTRTGYANGLATFYGTKSGLAPGAYTFTFRYADNSSTAQTPVITEGAAQAVTIFAGQTSHITGTIDGGKWHSSSITINAPGIKNFTLATAGDVTSVTPSTPLAIRASAESAQGNALKFVWCIRGTDEAPVNGVAPTPPAENYTYEYSFSQGTCGMYVVTCAAIDETAGVTESQSLYVEVGYAVTAPTSPITMGTAQTVFAPGDIVPLNYTGNLTNLTVTGVDADDIEWDNVTKKASFRMPAQTATITGTFE